MQTLDQLLKEFGSRVCTLTTGAAGLRGGLNCTVKEVSGDAPITAQSKKSPAMRRCWISFPATTRWIVTTKLLTRMDGNSTTSFPIRSCRTATIHSSIGKILGKDVLPKSQQIQGGKLCCRVLFAVDNPMGNLAYKMAKGGFIKSQSVGFIPLEWTNGNNSDTPDRTYTRCELLEKSLVVVPANPGATIGMALKQGVVERRDLRELQDYLRDFFSNAAVPRAKAGAFGNGVNEVRVLRLARGLSDILKS
jgi:hypothetical protein